jgi:hypothetical protein
MYGWLPLYLPELFPTSVRATGQGVCYNSGRVLAAVGAIEMGQLLQVLQRQLRARRCDYHLSIYGGIGP